MIYKPYDYQRRAADFILSHPYCALWLDMGLGKSVITLTAADRLLHDYLDAERVLVIAPLSVARNTWAAEQRKWDHLSRLRLSLVLGTAAKRRKALAVPADVYVINRENVDWLVDEYLGGSNPRPWPFDTVIVDEASSFKNYQSRRWKALWKARPFVRRMVQLTGTPAPNGLMDVWAQVKLLDMGERLGRFITDYRQTYFHPGAHNGAIVYEYLPNNGAKEAITERLEDITLSMQARDYIELPDTVDGGMEVELDPSDLQAYRRFERDCVATLPDGEQIIAPTAASLSNKMLQWAGGAVYDGETAWHAVHDEKLWALLDIVEASDGPVLVYYNYVSERERIMEALRAYRPVAFRGEPDILDEWNAGRIRVMVSHPASVGYGLNLQHGGHILVWFSPTWNLELYQQANARLLRQGQGKPGILYHLCAKGTIDEAVLAALRRKDDMQRALLTYLKEIDTKQ